MLTKKASWIVAALASALFATSAVAASPSVSADQVGLSKDLI